MLDSIRVEAYGDMTPLAAVAHVGVKDAQSLVATVYDPQVHHSPFLPCRQHSQLFCPFVVAACTTSRLLRTNAQEFVRYSSQSRPIGKVFRPPVRSHTLRNLNPQPGMLHLRRVNAAEVGYTRLAFPLFCPLRWTAKAGVNDSTSLYVETRRHSPSLTMLRHVLLK